MQAFDGLELVESFKIENGLLLKDFEHKLSNTKDSFLKGLFIKVSKEQLLDISINGFRKPESKTKSFRENCLRIPPSYLKNNQSVIEKMLDEPTGSKGLGSPLVAYPSSTC